MLLRSARFGFLRRRLSTLFQDGASNSPKKVFIEVYGCQMNTNDAEIVHGILQKSPEDLFVKVDTADEANVVLLMTCAIRENAESKIWSRLSQLKAQKKQTRRELTVGVLGCMAERLKHRLLEADRSVDLVCGPDSYRDLPLLLRAFNSHDRDQNMSVALSADETYGDIAPVRLDSTQKSAYVSIMRGCNNMCAFCIVPFTRGRERSRSMASVLEEIRRLVDQDVREITFLGQNVNSYCDSSEVSSYFAETSAYENAVPGFQSVYKARQEGARFVDLMDRASTLAPSVRFRFTSPHPKDFPLPLLQLIGERSNVCKQVHLPAQSGSNSVLDRMRRGYSRESYLELVDKIREAIPSVCLSTDMIAGFVGETDEDHAGTLALMKQVGYDMAYMYAYSMREKTMAHRRYQDNVPEDVKQSRLRDIIDAFYGQLPKVNSRFIGTEQTILLEGPSRKDPTRLQGRSDGNKTVILDKTTDASAQPGKFVRVMIHGVSGTALLGTPVSAGNSCSTGFGL